MLYVFQAVGPFEVFNKCPTVKFRLTWNQTALTDLDCSMAQQHDEFFHNNQMADHIVHSKSGMFLLALKNCTHNFKWVKINHISLICDQKI